jgi:hypothetical protein
VTGPGRHRDPAETGPGRHPDRAETGPGRHPDPAVTGPGRYLEPAVGGVRAASDPADRPPPWRQNAAARTGTQRLAVRLIRGACRRLPADARDERCREWTGEVRAIMDDPAGRAGALRSLRALRFAVGIVRCAGDPALAAGGARSARRSVVTRVAIGVGIYLCVVGLFVGLMQTFRWQGPTPLLVALPLAVCFDGFCLLDLARAGQVRYLPKWGWVLACLVQTPFGGIMYLTTGRARS